MAERRLNFVENTKYCIESVWLYSHYYGDMLFTSQRLFAANEGYAAVTILFNAMELLFKSLRENFKGTFNQDVTDLHQKNIITEDEKFFLIDENVGIHKMRNYMTHRNAYQYCFESLEGKALPFVEADTWIEIYASIAPVCIRIMNNAVVRCRENETDYAH